MGLPIVYAAAKSAGGFVRIESERDVGTRVSVYLPMCEQPEGTPSTASDATALPSS
jgi:signal transduction histidine kinase